jgi:hypothetical protein
MSRVFDEALDEAGFGKAIKVHYCAEELGVSAVHTLIGKREGGEERDRARQQLRIHYQWPDPGYETITT